MADAPRTRRLKCEGCRASFAHPVGPGQPPKRCPDCRESRPHRKTPVRRRRPLTVVQEDRPGQPVTDVEVIPPPPPGPASASPSGSIGSGVESAIATMPIGNPAAPALEAIARRLAGLLDAGVDERSVPTFARELRATLADLANTGSEAEEDDVFGFGSMSPTVVDSSQG